ncbi:hypothetical protein LCGC14_1386280, partial [marine sediment metagenome]
GYAPPPQAPPQQQNYNPPPQAPPQQQAPQQPPQRVPSEWDKPIDWHDKKQLLIVRQSSISNAISLLTVTGVGTPTPQDVLAVAKRFACFVYDGIVQDELDQHLAGGGPNPEHSENPPPPEPGDKF